jgi:hypothetical protein
MLGSWLVPLEVSLVLHAIQSVSYRAGNARTLALALNRRSGVWSRDDGDGGRHNVPPGVAHIYDYGGLAGSPVRSDQPAQANAIS